MNVELSWAEGLNLDVEFGYLNPTITAPKRHNPKVVLNTEGTSVLRTLREELGRCESFLFSVAFVTPRAIALLKQELVDFRGAGTIVTSDYLAFNSPAAFKELLNLDQLDIDVRIHPAQAFHPKGYIFTQPSSVTAMMGSSNLTETALVTNHEWNLKVSATRESDLGVQLRDLVGRQVKESRPLTAEWIEAYAQDYVPPATRPRRLAPDQPVEPTGIVPNAMQEVALASIASVRAAGHDRAIVISATGTGKTILSALDVRAVDPVRLLFVVHREQVLDKTITEYRKVLGGNESDYGKLTGSVKQGDRRYVFATVQTLSQPDVLAQFAPDSFGYVIIDEAHRAAAPSHRSVLDHFTPEFMLGMTATPERTDGFNVFELFDYNVPYEIRLNHALEAEMLAPFHYYGVSDLTYADGRTTTDSSELQVLISPDRVDHLIKALEVYGQAGVAPRGLIFCSRRDEATALSQTLNSRELRGRPLRTVALTGADSIAHREATVARLERGELDYILTVDVFNEGIDIPSINQIVMLRQTQSAIVFVQQLGRGLRKLPGKDYVVVIDFIGNYANNFLIPIALFGDESLNKESLRQNLISAEEAGVLPGLSSVRFDRVAQERVLRSIAETKLDGLRSIKRSLDVLKNRLGRMPSLLDLVRFESVDPVIACTTSQAPTFPGLLEHLYKDFDAGLSPTAMSALKHLSFEVLPAARAHEQELMRLLLEGDTVPLDRVAAELTARSCPCSSETGRSAADSLTLVRHSGPSLKRFTAVAELVGNSIRLREEVLSEYLGSQVFRSQVDELLEVSRLLVMTRYDPSRLFTPGRQYSRREVARLLCMPESYVGILNGYKVDLTTRSCPIFVTINKAEDVSASTAYEERLLDPHTMQWSTKSKRTLRSREVQQILSNELALHVFVRKNDADGINYFYLGQAEASDPRQTKMPRSDLDVVHMLLRFAAPIESALFDYFHPEITA